MLTSPFRAADSLSGMGTEPTASLHGASIGTTEEPLAGRSPFAETPPLGESDPATEAGRSTATDGYVVVRDGQLEITNPTGGGLLPVLIPSGDVILTIDGHEVTTPISVWAGQSVRVEPRIRMEPVRGYQIAVDPDEMAAWLSLSAPDPLGHQVIDAGPSHVVRLEVRNVPGFQASPTPAEIERALALAGVVAGIDQAAIARALESTGALRVQVAVGQPVVPSQPGRVETAVTPWPVKDPRPLGARVEPGRSLARLIPPQLGEWGHAVSGRLLEPKAVPAVGLRAGAGAFLPRDGGEVLAAIRGRPEVVEVEPGMFQASVIPVLEIDGPLTPGSAPHQSAGDIVIHGDVHDGNCLRAGGWIWVQGSVHGSILEAGQGIRVEKTVQRSRLTTRSGRRLLVVLLREGTRILADLEQMRDYASQIMNHPRYAELSRSKSLGEVMLLLAQNRFSHLRRGVDEVRKLLTDLSFLEVKVDLEAVTNTLEQRVYKGNLNGVDDLIQLIDAFAATIQRATEALDIGGLEAPVHVRTLLWSQVDADGEVVVYGSGAELTTVRARGRIHIPKLRNSHALSETAIEVGLAVASESDRTILEVVGGGEIHLGLAVTPIDLQVEEWRYRLPPESRGVHVDSDGDGRVRLTVDGPPQKGQTALLPAVVNGTYHPVQKN